ncbi:helix-turn-helix domain-containing protein [Myxococcota bacterium]|nr:helix-turn-helix domain-containing protein [Myxococcota bacterium]
MALQNPPLTPTAQETSLAKRSSQILAKHLKSGGSVKLKLDQAGQPEEVLEIPSSLLHLLHRVLEEMAKGNTLAIFPQEEELTTSQAAEVLGVSRPFLLKLLEDGEIAYRQVGSHRRITSKELVEYKERTKKQRKEVLDQLAAEAQELDMGY